MAYIIEIAPAAERQWKAIRSESLQQDILDHILKLETNPRPPGIKKIQGEESLYRLRVGDYRIIYEIQDQVLTILVLKIGHRREIYRRFR